MLPYEILLSMSTLKSILTYKEELQTNNQKPGKYLKDQLSSLVDKGTSLEKITTEQFIQLILSTKKIICFAESEIEGDGSDWNRPELAILGDLNVAMKVEVYDNGAWSPSDKIFKIHKPPFFAELLFTPGPLLHGSVFVGTTPDLEVISDKGQINQEKYTKLIEKRLLPLFVYASEKAKDENKKALVVLPGIGCGNFAGRYQGKMGAHLNKALQTILDENGEKITNLACVWYGSYQECNDSETTIHSIKYRVRKTIGPLGKPQLSKVEDFEEVKNEYQNCILYKIVAWDHVSLPGNDYYGGSRCTDDGVTAAATNCMEVMTGVKGSYNKGYYLTPQGSRSWEQVAMKNKTQLIADRNVKVLTPDMSCVELNRFETTGNGTTS